MENYFSTLAYPSFSNFSRRINILHETQGYWYSLDYWDIIYCSGILLIHLSQHHWQNGRYSFHVNFSISPILCTLSILTVSNTLGPNLHPTFEVEIDRAAETTILCPKRVHMGLMLMYLSVMPLHLKTQPSKEGETFQKTLNWTSHFFSPTHFSQGINWHPFWCEHIAERTSDWDPRDSCSNPISSISLLCKLGQVHRTPGSTK